MFIEINGTSEACTAHQELSYKSVKSFTSQPSTGEVAEDLLADILTQTFEEMEEMEENTSF